MSLRKTALLILVAITAPAAAATVDALDARLLEVFLAQVEQAPALGMARETFNDGIVTPLSKTTTRADGVTLGVVADRLRLATEPAVRQQFAGFADRFLAGALLRLPRRPLQSPDAPGLVEYRSNGVDGAIFLLAWHSDQPFASTPDPAANGPCGSLLPPFDAGPVPAVAPAGLQRRQVWKRRHEGHDYQRTTSWELRIENGQPRWVVRSDQCGRNG